jgi:hypothetical protein
MKQLRTTFLSLWPFQTIAEAVELQRLRQRMPRVYRGFKHTSKGTRPETDSEYLDRLREENLRRFGGWDSPRRAGQQFSTGRDGRLQRDD